MRYLKTLWKKENNYEDVQSKTDRQQILFMFIFFTKMINIIHKFRTGTCRKNITFTILNIEMANTILFMSIHTYIHVYNKYMFIYFQYKCIRKCTLLCSLKDIFQ